MSNSTPNSTTRLTYGRVSTQYEDGIVGNREGLRSLAAAINEALETGESEVELHEFTKVYCKPDCFFPPEEAQELGALGKAIFFLSCFAIAGLILAGAYTFFEWLS
ncbi:MAG: hypothetical protein AAF542_25895 [Pseudomonadota bacterium]